MCGLGYTWGFAGLAAQKEVLFDVSLQSTNILRQDILPGISDQAQKVIQGLDEAEASQGDSPLKLEPGTFCKKRVTR
ncbi:unnamed protein product [Ceratitis capitata]|uniref:(Mediterranean fruit fly) hypothetical protein n=1 Tax=Ceratitis capitata TaxID=7213 RepID=A0A811USR8_CERCA|nr:unnamed protein product [Ceratitis capitata]